MNSLDEKTRGESQTLRSPSPTNGALVKASVVAKRLGVSIAWVLDHASGRRAPYLPSVKLGKSVRFDPQEVERFIEHCKRFMRNGIPIQ